MCISIRPLVVLLLINAVHRCAAHYNLKSPAPYNKISCKASMSWCKKACPPIWRNGKASARNSPANPSAVWKRGQTVTIEWHKNNHNGGFYRRSLVPVKYMFDPAWHRKTAFEFGCWSQGTYQCGRAPGCGTDKRGRAYRNQMTVPQIFPDGDYAFAMVWYGGLHWQQKRGVFSDYHSCSFVKIRGGAFKPSHTPTFKSGGKGTCKTTSLFENECGGGPCEQRKPRATVPREFQGGRTPSALKASMFGQNSMKRAYIPESSMGQENKAIKDNNKDIKQDEMMSNGNSNSQNNPKNRNNSKNQNKEGEKKQSGGSFCNRSVPQKPTGSWGRKYSNKWWRQLRKWQARKNFCKKCRRRC
eukprot:IDg1541t1